MLYSVWRPELKQYDYYATPPSASEALPPNPTHLNGASTAGVAPEAAAWRLPAGARQIGKGPLARGSVAVDGRALSLGDIGSSQPPLLIAGLLLLAALGLREVLR